MYIEGETFVFALNFVGLDVRKRNKMEKKTKIYGIVLCLLLLMGFSIYKVQGKQENVKVTEDVTYENSETVVSQKEEMADNTVSDNTVSGNTVSDNSEVSGSNKEKEEQNLSEIETEEEYEYADFAFANVSDYVNVRNQPSTEGEIVGKIYDGAVAEILSEAGEENDWYKIVSGNVEGYIKAEFFLRGEEAASVMDKYVIRYAKVKADQLNVRKEASVGSDRIGYVTQGDKIKVIENGKEWVHVQYTDALQGYVAAQYVTVAEEFIYAKTLEEEAKEIAERQARQQREQGNTQIIPQIAGVTPPSTTYTSNEELRKEIINYAMQFVGNRYVSGGRSLAGGTDCSGFTSFIYADFGYSISRTPPGQYSGAGRSISLEEIQPGDIICYSSNGGRSCTHVALYIGDGQIVHSANSRKGVIVSGINFEPIIGFRNVID